MKKLLEKWFTTKPQLNVHVMDNRVYDDIHKLIYDIFHSEITEEEIKIRYKSILDNLSSK